MSNKNIILTYIRYIWGYLQLYLTNIKNIKSVKNVILIGLILKIFIFISIII